MAHEFQPQQEQQTRHSAGPQPRIPQPSAALKDVLPHAPRPEFLLRWHPERWALMDGDILPVLGTLKVSDLGVNGVDKTGNIDDALIMSMKNGWHIIPRDVFGPIGSEADYLRAYDCTGGTYYVSKWEIPQFAGNRALASKTDTAGYLGFLRDLLAKGIIPPPDPAMLEQTLLDVQAKRVENLRGKTNHPGVAEVFEVEKARLADMRTAADPKRSAKKAAKPQPGAA
jgi:hypothetical protein